MNRLAFTKTCSGITTKLINHVMIKKDKIRIIDAVAQWDTGATKTCISKDVVSKLKLTSAGTIVSYGVNSADVRNLYVVDIELPNNLTITGLKVQESEIGRQGIDILIGMDIISLGDFAISNYCGNTVFSFRVPSLGIIDYTKLDVTPKDMANTDTPCPCEAVRNIVNAVVQTYNYINLKAYQKLIW